MNRPVDGGPAPISDAPVGSDSSASPLPPVPTADTAVPVGSTGDSGTSVPVVDTGGPYVPSDPALMDRGLQWVRTEPMFVSGLVSAAGLLPLPVAADVAEYYDDFHATAAHLWESGMPDEADAWAAAAHPSHRFVSWVHGDGTSHWGPAGAPIGGYGPGAPGRIGFQVGDEPRDHTDLQELLSGIDVVRGADPDALVFVNFGNTTDPADLDGMLDDYVAHGGGDLICYDDYTTVYNSKYENLAVHRDAAMAAGMPYWRYMASYHDDGRDPPEASDLVWDAFVGLTFGYTGHSWFLYKMYPNPTSLESSLFDQPHAWGVPGNWRFDDAAVLNTQLANLGQAIVMLTSTEVRYVPSVFLPPAGLSPWSAGAGGDPYIVDIAPFDLTLIDFQDAVVGFFVDDNAEPYVALQNANHESADWPLYTRDRAWFRVTFDFAAAPAPLDVTRVRSLDKDTGAIVDLPLVFVGGTQAALEIELDAGEMVLFKYATGQPFALQP